MSPLQRKLRRALGSFKDQTSISLAKVAGNGSPDLEVALVKATSHDEFPVEDRHVQEILHLTSYSRSYVSACVAGLAKRLGKTHNWIVAIKALMLIHRLLRDGDPIAFEQELLAASRRGLRVLNLSNFRDDSHSHAWDYSAFVRTYALFLDERLDFNITAKSKSEDRPSNSSTRRSKSEDRSSNYRYDDGYGYGSYGDSYGHDNGSYGDSYGHGNGSYGDSYGHGYGSYEDSYGPARGERAMERSQQIVAVKDMKPSQLLDRIPSMQRLMERVLACRPTGAARMNRLVQIAVYPVVRESFQLYTDICDGLAIVLDAFFDMDHADCVKAFDIHSRASKQMDELSSFYNFCKNLGVCRSSEYPVVQRISEELLETMEDFLRNRAESARQGRKKSPDPPKPESPLRDPEPEQDMNSIKALPAPPPAEEADMVQPAPSIETQQSDADLLVFDNETVTAEEHGDKLALALFSDVGSTAQSSGSDGVVLNGERQLAGWELALVESTSELSRPNTNTLAGGFDNLLLTSMYDQAADRQKATAAVPSGSASSVALPGWPASSYLALPAPTMQAGEDPFAASLTVPPPSYVQMSDMKVKQQLLVQEQQAWYQYQRNGMQGYNGLMKVYTNGYNPPFQNFYSVPYYGTSSY